MHLEEKLGYTSIRRLSGIFTVGFFSHRQVQCKIYMSQMQ